MWIAYPVKMNATTFKQFWSASPSDFFRSASAVSRAFALYGRPGRNLTKSFTLLNANGNVVAGHLYLMRGIGAVAVLKFAPGSPTSLARPNVNSTALMLNSVGLLPDSRQITQTVVFDTQAENKDGIRFLALSPGSNEFLDDEFFPRFIAAITIERLILDLSMDVLSSSFVSARTARRLTSIIKFWISHPSIESEELKTMFHGIREKLDLDSRTVEIVDALNEITKRANTAFLSGSATTAGMLTLTDSGSMLFTLGPAWVLTSFAIGIVVWALVRGLRI